MIIGIDISRATREQKTGVEWYVFFLITEIKKMLEAGEISQDISFRVYSDAPVSGSFGESLPGWDVRVLRWFPKRFWTQIRLSIEMLFHPPDVLFIPAHVPPLIQPKKTIMTIHDIAAIRYKESYSPFEKWYSLFSAKQAMTSLANIIVPSQFTKTELESIFGKQREQDIFVIPHGYDHSFCVLDTHDAIQVARSYGITQPFLLSIGRLEHKKNTVRIIDAFHILKASEETTLQQLQLVLIGKPGYGYEYVAEAIQKSPYRDDIIIPGWVEQRDLPFIMNAASVFVFPSVYEGFGLPILEALACATPVVTTVGHSAQEVGGTAAIYVERERTDDIAKAIRRLLLDTTLYKTQQTAGLLQVAQFSWEKAARETLRVLSS